MAIILNRIAIVCLILAAAGAGISVWLWFKLDVYKIWSDMTGKTQQKAIEEIQKQRLESRQAGLKMALNDADRVTNEELEQIWSESRVLSGTDEMAGLMSGQVTELVDSADLETDVTGSQEVTEVTTSSMADDVEEAEEMTELLDTVESETEVLDNPESETEVLDNPEVKTEVTADGGTEILTELEPESEVLSEDFTERLPDLSEYLSNSTMELGENVPNEEPGEKDLNSDLFEILDTIKITDALSRII